MYRFLSVLSIVTFLCNLNAAERPSNPDRAKSKADSAQYEDGADNLLKLKQEVADLQKKVNQLALSNGSTKSVAASDVSSDVEGKFHIGGFIQMVAMYDIDQVGYAFNRDYTYIPELFYKDQAGKGNTRKSLRMHVKQSRLVFTYDDKGKFFDDIYPIHAFLDIDFYNGKEGTGVFTHSFQPRLRSACFDIGNLKVGLFWSLFMDVANFPVTIDFGSATGTTMLRQPQIRYVHKLNDVFSLAGSIENSDSTFVERDGATRRNMTLDNNSGDYRSNSIFPDIIGALLFNDGVRTGGLKFVWAQTRVAQTAENKSAAIRSISMGASLGWKFPNKDKFIAHCNFGSGLARYLHEAACHGIFYDKEENKFHRHKALGFTFGYTHFWKPNLHSSVTVGRTLIRLHPKILNQSRTAKDESGNDIDNPDLVKAEDNFFRYCTSFHANLIWALNSRVEIGIEYLTLRKAPAKFANPIKTDRKKAGLQRILTHFKMNIG